MSRTGPGPLYDRLTRKIDQGKAIQLSLEELDWFVVCGAYAKVVEAAVRERTKVARVRLEASGEDLSWLDSDQQDTRDLPSTVTKAALRDAP